MSRTRILDVAERLFADLGFDATPTARLASEAGVPKGLVFHYFPTKLDILLTLVRERAHIDRELFGRSSRAAPAEAPPTDVADALLSVAQRVRAGGRLTHPLRRIILREGRTHPEVQATGERFYLEVVRHVRDALDRVLPPDEPDERSRDAAAVTFTAALMHALSQHTLAGTPFDMRPVAAVVAAALGQPWRAGRPRWA